MDSSPGTATVQAQLVSVSAGLVQGPQQWWSNTEDADAQALANPQAREAESAACPGLLRPDPWR